MGPKSPKENNLTWHNGYLTREDRERLHGHRGAVIWFTGLSASGKSTIALHLEKRLYEQGCSTYVFDGDNVRHGLCADLGFSPEDRTENIRRIAEMTKLYVDAGILAITAFISPYRKDRAWIRRLVGADRYFEIYVECPVDVCAKRDQKGLYKKAMNGEIPHFTGVSAPYEPPEHPDLIVHSDKEDAVTAADRVLELIKARQVLS
ncbi:MAG: adenylyl-sulfate kinase [Deltaproteobacteria bacterium]|jgi:adenylylsulfate kinase